VSQHRAPRRPGRRAVTPVAALALSAAALTAVAPMASAQTLTHDRDSDAATGAGSVGILNNLTLLPVQACGLQVPVLSGILDGPSGSCTQSDD
jgi:hypothetical protein